MDQNDFFTSANAVYGVTEDDYLNIEYRLESLKAIERLSSQKFYVIDYFKKTFLYVSEVFADFCGFSIEELKEIGFDLYIKCVPKEDLCMLLEINRQQFRINVLLPTTATSALRVFRAEISTALNSTQIAEMKTNR